jgi:iduronate 2-sulfatase
MPLLFLLSLFSFYQYSHGNPSSPYQTNVLYIMYDDLRPLFHAYGEKYMITPNFDRLASKSIIFQNAYCQVAVCSPSRTSLMSGLRPDTLKGYSFDRNHYPNVGFPDHFKALDYNIAGYGKLYHNDEFPDSTSNIGYGLGKSDWYGYQNSEEQTLNSTVVPDKQQKEELFRDYIFATKAIEGLKTFRTTKTSRDKFFFLGIGFKLPHTRLHFPHSYYDLYRSKSKIWTTIDSKFLRFPPSAPSPSYRCCTYIEYQYMSQPDEGQSKFTESFGTYANLNISLPVRMWSEQMWSYCASISFLDVQLGRLLDTIDELDLWNNITIVLTADHVRIISFFSASHSMFVSSLLYVLLCSALSLCLPLSLSLSLSLSLFLGNAQW